MTTATLRSIRSAFKNGLMLLLAASAPFLLLYLGIKGQEYNPGMGVPDAGIWQLSLFSACNFLGFTALAWWLLQRLWRALGLPAPQQMVSQFKKLDLWQQFAFFWASFALLLWAALQCLTAVF